MPYLANASEARSWFDAAHCVPPSEPFLLDIYQWMILYNRLQVLLAGITY